MTDILDDVRDHYRATGLIERLKTALMAFGPEKQRLMPQQLAALDQFHTLGLAATAEAWLAPLLLDKTSLAGLPAAELEQALHALLPYALRRRLEIEAPTHFDAPSGSRVPIDYEAEEGPTLAIRVQELFGLSRHPAVAGGRAPLVIELLSPAHRLVQVTRDLPQFWRGSYAAVRSEMRGRYPRHSWPDDPLSAPAKRRAKPRGC